MALVQIQRDDLIIENGGEPLASGGSALLFEVSLRKMTTRLPIGTYLFKEYKSFHLNAVSSNHLKSVVDRIEGNKDSKLISRLTLPLALVTQDKLFVGFLMKKLDNGCKFLLTRANGQSEDKLMRLDYFLASADVRKKLSVPELDPWRRWALILDLWETLSKLHESGVVVGDMSDKNLVIQRKAGANPRVRDRLVILDVDSFSTRTHLLNLEATTALWDCPENPAKTLPGAKLSDVYKAGLVTVRLLYQMVPGVPSSFKLRESNEIWNYLKKRFSPEDYELLTLILSDDPNERPSASEVFAILDYRIGRNLALKNN